MKRILKIAAAAALPFVLLAGCDRNKHDDRDSGHHDKHMDAKMDAKSMATNGPTSAVAVAKVAPSKAATTQPSWGKAMGTVTFTAQDDGKTKVVVDLTGVPPGKHGFHIHEKGDLSAPDLTSTGGHFNPDKHPHAGPDAPMRHAGDLGNLDADASGNVKKELTTDGISIGSWAANDIVGKAVILHVKADDLKSQPTGDAGGRIAGGLIEKK
ncbi:MAG: superoxide dismutase family protein [Tepidisphaeraceae bacterium]